MTDREVADATRAVEAEQALVGAVLLDDGVLGEIGDLGEDAFSLRQHGMILEACRQVSASGQRPDLVTVSARLEADGLLQQVGGFSYLSDLGATVPSTENARYYADLVRAAWARRRAKRALEAALRLVQDGTAEPADVAARATEAVQVLTQTRGAPYVLLQAGIDARYDDYAAAAEQPASGVRIESTGFRALDRIAMPWEPGDLIVLSADGTGAGKTSMALQVALAVATAGLRVLYCAAEMSVAAMVDRLFVQEAGVDLLRARRGLLADRDWDALASVRTARAAAASRLWLDDSVRTSWDAVARAQRLAAESGHLGLVVIDHLHQLSDRGGRGETRAEVLGAIVRRCKALAMDLGCVVLLVAQTNRAGRRAAEDRDPDASDLKGSGDIEDQADEVLMIRHPKAAEARPLQPARVIVAKHRSGPTGSVDLWWEPARARFLSVQRDPAPRRGDDPDVRDG
jgi:replicative DNA helicase